MNAVTKILAETPEEELERILAPFIREQFPSFMKENYSKLVLLTKAYYEWLDQNGNVGNVLYGLEDAYDVDQNSEEFYSHFKNTYLSSFPELFAVDTDGNKPNKKTLLKKIRDFYGNKGTESAYRFLFKILYDSDLEFYYPKTDVLKVSDGQWIEPKSIKTTLTNGQNLFSANGGQISQYNGTELVATALIDAVVQYQLNGVPICEFFVSGIIGDFSPNREVIITKNETTFIETAYPVLGEFFVELPGQGYKVGNTVSVTDESGGTGFSAKIDQVGLAGGIKRISITNSGVNYPTDIVLNIFNDFGTQNAKVVAIRSAVTNYPGYYRENRGKVSSNKKIQDGHYYQDFSYELKSRISLDSYFEVLRNLVHPAGLRMFGSILSKASIDNTISSSTQATFSETPIIGQFTPYTLRTFNNLRNSIFLPNQVLGATLQVWLSTYTVEGNTSAGVSAGWTSLGYTALGVNVWNSLVGGFTFGHYPAYEDVWTTPRFKEEAVNTHPSLVFRPINDSTSDLYSVSTNTRWRSFGYGHLGPTMGRLGLTASRSYFVVCKPRRLDTIGSIGSPSGNTRHILSDSSGQHGIAVGYTGGNTIPRVFGWNTGASRTNWVIGDLGPTGEWKLISQTFLNGSGNSGPLSLFLNGICLGTTSSAQLPTSAIQTSRLGIGMPSNTVDTCFDGEIAEILCYQGDVGEADRQKIEGYLAHKYDLAGKLPSTHPYKNIVPGGSFAGGKWYGNTGDYYPIGYNPYIGSTAQVGANGTTAPLGSVFANSGLGYTYTVADENGITAHNPTGSPLGSTASWWDNGTTWGNKESTLDPSHISGLMLWLKPENIGVCGSAVNGASVDVWRDSSPSQNHALPPTWGRFNGAAYSAAGVTIDKLRPTISFGSIAGPTGVCFNGGALYAPTTTWNGASLAQWIQLGNTHGAGTTAERILSGQHIYLTNPLNLQGEVDIFMVVRPTVDGYDRGLGLFSSDAGLTSYRRDDTVLYHRSYNPVDRNTALANSTYYRVLPNGSLLYPSVSPSGLVGFRPSGSKTGVQQNSMAYDPHVSGVCFGVAVGEWTRNSSFRLQTYLNGHEARNYSLATGRKIAAVNTPNTEDYLINSSLILWLDSGKTNSYPGSGTSWFDISGNSHVGTLMGGPVFSSEAGGVLVFDGLNDSVHIPSTTNHFTWTPSGVGNNTLSIEMWVRSTDTSGRFLSKPWNGNGEYDYWITHNSFYNTVGTQQHDLAFPTLSTGNWEHIFAILTPTEKIVYRNGSLIGSVSHSITNNTPTGGNGNLSLCIMTLYPYGSSWTGDTNYGIQGNVGIVRMYSQVLTADQIRQNYNILRQRFGA